MKQGTFTKEEDIYILDNYEEMTYTEIGNHLDRARQSISDRLKKLGKKKTTAIKNIQLWSVEELELIKNEYEMCPDIKKLFPHRSEQSIHFKAWELGLKRIVLNRYSVNHNYFKTHTPMMFYTLGLIAADGHIGSYEGARVMSLTLHRNDRYILDMVSSDMENERPIHKHSSSNCDSLIVSGETIYNDLTSLGIVERKSLILEWSWNSSEFSDEMLKYYILGYIDGDGCIIHYTRNRPENKYKKTEEILELSILGTEHYLVGMSKEFNRILGTKVMSTSKPKTILNGKLYQNISKIKYSGKSARIILKWLYDKEDNIYMKRKKDKYLSYLNLTGKDISSNLNLCLG